MAPSAPARGSANVPQLSIELFGHFRMQRGDDTFAFEGQRRALPLLAYLLLNRATPVARDSVAFALYPDLPEADARATVRRNLHVMQRALPAEPEGRPWLIAAGDTLRWNPQAGARIDVVEFERLLASDPENAVDLYRGDLLEGLYDEWLFPERERLRARYLAALTGLMHEHRRARRFPAAIACAARLLAAEPLREDAARTSIAAKYEAGDRAGALADYRAFARRLRAELGADPMPETLALRDAILRSAPIDIAAPPHIRSGGVAATAAAPLVGRAAALERLYAAWSRAARGSGEAVFVSGEAGIGKTRLAAELARRVESEGARILHGRTPTIEETPYHAIAEALGSAAPLLATLPVEPMWLRVVSAICPQLATDVEALPTVLPIEPERERARLCEGIARCFAALAGPRPLLVVLEDVHGAGSASIGVLKSLVYRAVSKRVLLVLTFREEEVPRDHALRKLRQELIGARVASTIALARLTPGDATAMAQSLLAGTDAAASEAERIAGESGGNPLFVVQLSRDAAERDRGSPRQVSTVDEVIAARLDRVHESARRCADVAAVLGSEFDVELVSGVLGWPEGDVAAAFEELLERHLVRETSVRSLFTYSFAHELVRVAAYTRIDEERRRRYHALAARALEARHGTGDEAAAERAHHLTCARAFAEAAASWLRAARYALARHAPDEADAFASKGLRLEPDAADRIALLQVREEANGRRGRRDEQRRDGDELLALANGDDVALRCDVLARRVALLGAVNDLSAQAAAIDDLERFAKAHDAAPWAALALRSRASLLATLRKPFDAEPFARDALRAFEAMRDVPGQIASRAALGQILALQNRFDEALDTLVEAAAAADLLGDPLLRGAVLASRGVMCADRQDFAMLRSIAHESVALARACGDRLGEARALSMLANASLRLYDVDAYFEASAAAAELCAAVGDAEGLRYLEHNAAAYQTSLGFPGRGLAGLRAIRDDARRRGDVHFEYFTTSNIGVALFAEGRYAEACVEEERALALARTLGNERLQALVLGDFGAARSMQGRHAEAVAALSACVEILERLDVRMSLINYRAHFALALARAGDLARAATIARSVLATHERGTPPIEDPAEILWCVAQVLRAADHANESKHALAAAAKALDDRLGRLAEPYREAYAAIRWHRELRAARNDDRWPELVRSAPERENAHGEDE